MSASSQIELDHFFGLNAIPNSVLFHPNGQNYIFPSGGNLVLGDLSDVHYQEILSGHTDSVTCVAISNNGSMIASGQKGENPDVNVWNFTSHEIIFKLEEHDGKLQAIAFSHDDKILGTLGSNEDGKLMIWDMSNGYIIASAKPPLGSECIAFGGFVKDIKRRNTQNYLLCTGGKDGLMIWHLDPFKGDFDPVKLGGEGRLSTSRHIMSLQFSSDYELIYGATTSGEYVIASVRSSRVVQTIQATRMAVSSIAIGLDAGVVIGCGDTSLKFFDRDAVFNGEIRLDSPVISLSSSKDLREILAATSMGSIFRVNASTRQYITISEAHTQAVVAIAFSFDQNDKFATASLDGTIRVWDIADYAVLATGHARREQERGVVPSCLGFSDILISGWSDGRVLAHSPNTGENLWFIDNAHPGGVTAIALSHNGRFLLTGGPGGEVRLWEMKSRELISHLKEHVQKITSLTLFDDDSMAISASRDRCILRWDLRTEKRTHSHMQRMGGINGIALSRDEQFTLSVGQEKKLSYWNNKSIEVTHQVQLDADEDEGRCIARSNNGKYIATGGSMGMLRLFDYESAALLFSGGGHSGTINGVAFSPDDKQVVTVGEDGCVFIWCIFS